MNCKPGDLAVLVGGSFRENIGAIVEVVESSFEYTARARQQIWIVRITGRALKANILDSGCVKEIQGLAHARDVDLRPVTGLPFNEDAPEELTVPA